MRVVFYKRGYDEMVIEILAEEYTSAVTAANFQDYYGNIQTLTLRHVYTGDTISVPIYEIAPNTFESVVALADIPFGFYQLQGRVEDVLGNAAVISDYHDPQDLPVQPVEIMLEVGYNLVPVLSIEGNYSLQLNLEALQYSDVVHIEYRGVYSPEISVPCR